MTLTLILFEMTDLKTNEKIAGHSTFILYQLTSMPMLSS